MADLDPEIRAHYELGREADRLSDHSQPSGPLEFVRTQELILRHLPEGPLRILDVGGGPGLYAQWLMSLGHDVALIDPVPLHVEQARARGVSADLGDAREIECPSDSFDVVLLLGPLYHLVERSDRVAAWTEARRVSKPGGLIFAAAISRFAALFDLLIRLDLLHEASIFDTVETSISTGVFGGGENGLFTTAYFHRPPELRAEAEEAGLRDVQLFAIEGPGFMVNDFPRRWADPSRREALLLAARLVESDLDLLGAASHLLVVGRH